MEITLLQVEMLALRTLSDNVYRWYVQSIDKHGNMSLPSSNALFSVNIPMLVYTVGDIDSKELLAVFNKVVYSEDNESGDLTVTNISLDDLGGATAVVHTAGSNIVKVTSANVLTSGSNTDSVNVATFAASTSDIVYGVGGAPASTSSVVIRQLVASENVQTADGFVSKSNPDNVKAFDFKIGGWTNGNVMLNSIDLTLSTVFGSMANTNFNATPFVLKDSAGATVATLA